MPLLLILLMLVSCLSLPWPARPEGVSPLGCLILVVALMSVSILTTAFYAEALRNRLRKHPEQRSGIVRSYGKFQRRIPWVTLGLWIVAAVPAGWAHAVREYCTSDWSERGPLLWPGAELLVSLPYFAALAANWSSRYRLDRDLYRTSEKVKNGKVQADYWSLPGYLLFQTRTLLLYLGLPMGLAVVQQTLSRFAPEFSASDAAAWLTFVGSFGTLVVFPWLVPRFLGLKRMPQGERRAEFEQAGRRLGIRFAQFYVWPTRGQMINAMVLGIVSQLRYVIFTDRLLEELTAEERLAVFGHEAGHARHHHLPYYVLFLVLSGIVVGAATIGLNALIPWPEDWTDWTGLLSLPILGIYLFVVFGWLSRRCERQADVFGCRVASCDDPQCLEHDEGTKLGGRDSLCPSGIRAMIRALDRVGDLTGSGGAPQSRRAKLWALVRAWQHGPMHGRIEFLQRMQDDPTLAAKADSRAYLARLGLALGLGLFALGFGFLYGWAALVKLM